MHGILRFFLWLLAHSVYWLRVHGARNVPRHGGALLVCNRITHLDWLFLYSAQRRPIRFVVFLPHPPGFLHRQILRITRAIAVDGSADSRAVIRALHDARAALTKGELVCIFAEERVTRCGVRVPLRRALRMVTKKTRVPIIPVALDQIWGSRFHVDGERIHWMPPVRFPYAVTLSYGAPLPTTTCPGVLRQAMQKVSADGALARGHLRLPVHRQFVRMAARRPFAPCLHDSTATGPPLTYARVLAGAICLARALKPILGKTKMVAIWLPPGIGGALANIALPLLGKTSVNLNYTASSESIRAALHQCSCRHVITARRFTARIPFDPGPGVELVNLDDISPTITQTQRLVAYLTALLVPGVLLDYVVLGLGGHKVSDIATVIFSSGSTGDPKGVMLTHENVASDAESTIQATGVTSTDRLLGVLPFFHSFGYTVSLWVPLQVGASMYFHADPRQAKEIGELCKKHRCTIYLSTATFLRFCFRKCEPDAFRSVYLLMCGAEKLPRSLAHEFAAKFGVLPIEGYGCTELSPAVVINMPDRDFHGFRIIRNHPGAIGEPMPGIAARIVHPETYAPLPVGAEGLLQIYGPMVMKGYLGKPSLTAEVVRDGWYATGDMGRMDDDGYVTLTGRLARFAKIGGEMVPLEKVEEVLHDILQTTERVCAVTCVPDDTRGERLVVLHVAHDGVEVTHWWHQLNSRGLPNLWVPAQRDFFNVPELPVLASGKLNLKLVKELAVEIALRRRQATC
jgi:acyl-[acyl-carrier-protein]-phospholipid O-acyltransferase/long-chain-fatty-acid--[acyl-carrier-protein] ligase